MLSQKDIENISDLGFNKNDFYFLDIDGFFKLRNINGDCFFLDENQCKIYTSRPQGCRFYPIIFDLNLNKAILDDECPLISTIQNKTVQSFNKDLQKFIQKLIEEKNIRETS